MEIISKESFLKNNQNSNDTVTGTDRLDQTVLAIINEVKQKKDEALRAYTAEFDGVTLDDMIVSEIEFAEAKEQVGEAFIQSLRRAKENITAFHEHQIERSWFTNPGKGIMLGQKVSPLDRVGIYVPGGTAAYPSSVLMNAIPAKIAGVKQVVMTTPPQKDGKVNPYVLVAAQETGVDIVYKLGGAQAVAALAYGTETIQKVDKIVGPGNAYVACAKKWVFGDVAIDMIAGPSEICVLADDRANPRFVAADLLSQAEHDTEAAAICVTTSETFAKALQEEVKEQTKTLERKTIIEKSLEAHGRIILANTLEEAFDLVNELAPEHLQLMIENPLEKVESIQHAGAIFLGDYAPEALGDYLAGPNHTLPTSGTAIFSSPLGVYDFIKRSSIIQYSKEALLHVADDITTIARAEGLTAHAEAIEKRKEE